jgi:hypothetical protein
MAGFTVFYSWQNDLPRDIARDIIHDAAEIAIAKLAQNARLEDSPRLDHDTEGVSGAPAIGDTILAKIDQCGAFIADVSIIGKSHAGNTRRKYLPNPNVLLELGYAAARVGWDRVVLVMNQSFGRPERLPFDLRYRRFPLRFSLRSGADSLDATRQQLAGDVELALRAVLDTEHQRVTDIIRRLDRYSLQLMRTNGGNQYFWEAQEGDTFSIISQLNLGISNLLTLGVIECETFAGAPLGYAYTWTYRGRLCLKRLGFHLPPPMPLPQPVAQPVIVDSSQYDGLLKEACEDPGEEGDEDHR